MKKNTKKKGGGLQATPDISESRDGYPTGVSTETRGVVDRIVHGSHLHDFEAGLCLAEKQTNNGPLLTETQISQKNGGGLKATPECKVELCLAEKQISPPQGQRQGTPETFEETLQEHAELLEIARRTSCNTAVRDSVAGRSFTPKPRIAAHTFCTRWMRTITVLLFGFNWEDLATSGLAEVAAENLKNHVDAMVPQPEPTLFPSHNHSRVDDAEPAEWLLWQKTRDEIFGLGVPDWEENWAAHLIFGENSETKQLYLWKTLSRGKHHQFGMGVLKIPTNRRRGLSFTRRAKSRFNRSLSHGVDRGGGSNKFAPDSVDNCPSVVAPVVPVDCVVASGVFNFTHRDICTRGGARSGQSYVHPKAGQCIITFTEEDVVVPESVRASSGGAIALDTEARHNACAMHSVFGRPTQEGKLCAENPRQLAQHLLQAVPEKAARCPEVRDGYDCLQKTFWEEFVIAHLKGSASVEADVFWRTLCREEPVVSRDARDQFHHYQQRLQHTQQIKRQVLHDCLRFFTDELKPLVHMLAVEMEYLPSSEVGVDLAYVHNQNFEGHGSVCDSSGFIKGSRRVVFPTDGPSNKYEALFDKRPVFDPIRESFLVFGDAHSGPDRIIECLNGIIDRAGAQREIAASSFLPPHLGAQPGS